MEKKYKLEVKQNEEGIFSVLSENDGFNPFELLGILTFKQEDIIKQIRGEIKPDVISRIVIKD